MCLVFPASCFHIWFVSCPRLMWLLVNSCPAVFVTLSMIYLCIYSPVCSVWFRLVYSLLPGVPVCQPCLVLPCLDVFIKDYYLSLRPRLRVLVPPCCVHRDSVIAIVLITSNAWRFALILLCNRAIPVTLILVYRPLSFITWTSIVQSWKVARVKIALKNFGI